MHAGLQALFGARLSLCFLPGCPCCITPTVAILGTTCEDLSKADLTSANTHPKPRLPWELSHGGNALLALTLLCITCCPVLRLELLYK